MRAKFIIQSVTSYQSSEKLLFSAVGKTSYDTDGNDENNTYAKWTPSATLEIVIANPKLIGTFKPGDAFYVDFTKV